MKYRYKYKANRIYTIMDFEENEIVEFAHDCEKPNSKANGYAYYRNKEGRTNLCHISDLEPIENEVTENE